MNISPRNAFIPILALLILLLPPYFSVAVAGDIPSPAPLNPDFADFLGARKQLKSSLTAAAEGGHTFGYVPEPVDFSYLRQQQQSLPMAREMMALPSSYDLRDLGKVTPVRNQGSCGSCWSFATMGSLESNHLPGETWDFSENNLKNSAGWDWGACDGGNGTMSTAYVARWGGPVSESDDPYNAYSSVSPAGLTPRKIITDVVILPGRGDSLDNDNIKQALMSYGALYTSYYHNDSYYKSSSHSYYYSGVSSSNHAVTIVGWDDSYPASSFSTPPPGNGAFIIKNSWGTGWGESGYFYISYYDSKLAKGSNYVFREGTSTASYSRAYQYDPLGWTSHSGYNKDNAWFANVFTAEASENLVAVAFYTAALDSSYEIHLYTGVSSMPVSGALAATTTGSIAEAGYHTVQLPVPVTLTAGQRFSIVVKLTTPGYNYPIPLERPISGAVSATASSGQSFMSSNGSSWTDIASNYANTNACLKGFTASQPPSVISTSPAAEATDIAISETMTATFSTAMAPLTVNPSTFTLSDGSRDIAGSVSYDAFSHIASFTPSSPLSNNTMYTATITTGAENDSGVPLARAYSWSFTTGGDWLLSLTFVGSGSANSVPAGIACSSDSSGNCTAQFAAGETVTLTASGTNDTSFLSHFYAWTGECDITNGAECSISMDADKNITVTFVTNQPVYIPGVSYFDSLPTAYDTGTSGCTIMAQAVSLPSSDLVLDQGKVVSLEGGYDSKYAGHNGYTTMNGVLRIESGSLTVDGLIIR